MIRLLVILSLLPLGVLAQSEELKQRTSLFLEEQKDAFKAKYSVSTEPRYGVLKETQYVDHQYYQLKQIEKEVNELGNSVRPKYDLSTFCYEDKDELMYALKFWFKEFIGNKRITPGRDYKTDDHIKPANNINENNYISILTLSCYATDIDESVIGEIHWCIWFSYGHGGRNKLQRSNKWTKNALILKTLSGVNKIKQESRLPIDLRSYGATSLFTFRMIWLNQLNYSPTCFN